MLDTNLFGQTLQSLGFNFYSGVPCSFLKYLINYAINECDFVMAANEGDAIAICAGAYLGGKKSVLLCQNSGLANAFNPLTSLNPIFKIPLLGFVSLRGEPGIGDQPQHEMMGLITTKMLDIINVKWEFLSNNIEEATEQLKLANNEIENNKSFFFVVKKGTFAEALLQEAPLRENDVRCPAAYGGTRDEQMNGSCVIKTKPDACPTRFEALTIINKCKDSSIALLATTGGTGRELYEIEDAPNNFYMVGSMGCVSSIGLGILLAQNKKSVIAVDGDGALLMRLGVLPTNASYTQSGMLHILLDNNAHDTTGGQATVSQNIDFVTIAVAAGYPCAYYAHNLDELEQYLTNWKKEKKLTFLHIKIAKGMKPNVGRPHITPEQVKVRIKKFLMNVRIPRYIHLRSTSYGGHSGRTN